MGCTSLCPSLASLPFSRAAFMRHSQAQQNRFARLVSKLAAHSKAWLRPCAFDDLALKVSSCPALQRRDFLRLPGLGFTCRSRFYSGDGWLLSLFQTGNPRIDEILGLVQSHYFSGSCEYL